MPQKQKTTTKKDGKKTAAGAKGGKKNTLKTPAEHNELTRQDDAKVLAKLDIIEPKAKSLETAKEKDRIELGGLLLPVRKNKWFRARGFTSFGDYTEEVLHLERREALKITDEAQAYTVEQFLKLGESRADIGLLLLNATPEHDTVEDLETATLRYGSGKGKKFLEATIREIREDIAGERGKQPKPAKPPQKPTTPVDPPTPEQSTKGIPKQYQDLPKMMETVFPGAHVVVYSVPLKSGKGAEVRFDIRGLKADDYTGSVTGLKNLLKLDEKHGKDVKK